MAENFAGDNPFVLEMQVDDEITFKVTRKEDVHETFLDENIIPGESAMGLCDFSTPAMKSRTKLAKTVEKTTRKVLGEISINRQILYHDTKPSPKLPSMVNQNAQENAHVPVEMVVKKDRSFSLTSLVTTSESNEDMLKSDDIQADDMDEEVTVEETGTDFVISSTISKSTSSKSLNSEIDDKVDSNAEHSIVKDSHVITSTSGHSLVQEKDDGVKETEINLSFGSDLENHPIEASHCDNQFINNQHLVNPEVVVMIPDTDTQDIVKIKDEEISRLKLLLESNEEEISFLKIQTRALSQQILSLESQCHKTELDKQDCIQNLSMQHEFQLAQITRQWQEEKRIELSKNQVTYETQISELKSHLTEKDTFNQDVLNRLQLKEQTFEEELVEAVRQAKQQVYEKVKNQFEAGNKEFQKVRNQLRISEENIEKLVKSIESKDQQLSQQSRLVETHSIHIQNLKDILQSVSTSLGLSIHDWDHNNIIDGQENAVILLKTISTFMTDHNEIIKQKDVLKSAVASLESALSHRETSLNSALLEIQSLNDRVTVAEALLNTCRLDLSTTSRELELKSKQLVEVTRVREETQEKLNLLDKSQKEWESRCGRLRKMNEELVGMLEARVYGGKESGSNNSTSSAKNSGSSTGITKATEMNP